MLLIVYNAQVRPHNEEFSGTNCQWCRSGETLHQITGFHKPSVCKKVHAQTEIKAYWKAIVIANGWY